MDKFLDEMAEILEVAREEISLETEFRNVEDWGSLMGFSILVTMESEYGVKITVPEFLEMKTLGDIFQRISKQ